MDTTYFNQYFGVMVFRDHYTKRNIYWKYLSHENLYEYRTGIQHIKEQGWKIVGIVCDGKRGLLGSFGKTPVQLCQFHQVAMITRYLTRKPKLQAGIELKKIVSKLTLMKVEEFETNLEFWYKKWEPFLKEMTYNPETKKRTHTHRRLRSAYRSLKTNLPYLFTFQKYPELNIPNTTNSIEGMFSGIKTKLRNHSGLRKKRKIKLLDYLLGK